MKEAPASTKVELGEESSAEARSKRLKILREMTGLSRDLIRKRYGIARGTLQNWESARFGGLTNKGARIIIRAFQAEGIHCTLQWLLHGIGADPEFATPTITIDISTNSDINEAELNDITAELLCFRNNNPNAIDLVVTDDSLTPYYRPGDFVAGNRYYRDNIEKTVDRICILQTLEHGTLLRYLRYGDEPNQYHLLTLNPTSNQVRRSVLYNVEIISSAPVLWMRRPEIGGRSSSN